VREPNGFKRQDCGPKTQRLWGNKGGVDEKRGHVGNGIRKNHLAKEKKKSCKKQLHGRKRLQEVAGGGLSEGSTQRNVNLTCKQSKGGAKVAGGKKSQWAWKGNLETG